MYEWEDNIAKSKCFEEFEKMNTTTDSIYDLEENDDKFK